MDTDQMRQAKKLADDELAAVDAEFEVLKLRRESLQALSKAYEVLLRVGDRGDQSGRVSATDVAALVTAIRPLRPVKMTLDGTEVGEVEEVENLPSRIIRTLQKHSPSFITPRQLMIMLQQDGWTTTSNSPISVVRNTVNELEKRTEQMRKHPMGAQQIGYAWIEAPEWAAMQDAGSG